MELPAGGPTVTVKDPVCFIMHWQPCLNGHRRMKIIFYIRRAILKNVVYGKASLSYFSPDPDGTEYLKISFKPSHVNLNGAAIQMNDHLSKNGYKIKSLNNGDYSLIINRTSSGDISIE